MISYEKPTETAERLLSLAWNQSNEITDFEHLGRVLGNLALGLMNISVGLRATYIKLEEVEALIRRQAELAQTTRPFPPVR
jgi:hypothetical protein